VKRPLYDLSAAARLDLLKIWKYLAANASLNIADKVSADIESAIHELASSPGLGHRRPDLTPHEILFYRVHSYLIVYRPEHKPVHILRVLHAARDLETMLEG